MSQPLMKSWDIQTHGQSGFTFTCSVLTKLRGLVQYSGSVGPDATVDEIAELMKDLEARAVQLAKAEAPT
jgi:hypothetical protein